MTDAAFTANYDESKVPQYTLPDPLVCLDGAKVTDARTWFEKRRPEILELFKTHVYGRSPGKPAEISYALQIDNTALNGRAIRKQITITPKVDGKTIDLNLLVYLPPNAKGPVPLFIGLNFRGNHTICDDPGIRLAATWMPDDRDDTSQDNRATEKARGKSASRWALDPILSRGYGLATMYCGDIDPDFHDEFKNGVHALYDTGQPRTGDDWGTIAAWAWGLSRCMDYFEKDPDIDHSRVAVMGHSRLGKTSLWAGASDPRFALVISNDSGCGGAALSKRAFGETVGRINTSFPHWFCDNFKQYNENEAKLPLDQHMLIALVAPRPVYVASAQDDRWADPRGEFLSAQHADPVYRLLTGNGLPAREMPDINQPTVGRIGYHIRAGKHDVTEYDWIQYLDFADRWLKNK
ncbi:MAG: hypothetical protein JW828_15220 [Sedimentisphaerales bacterium]|nr:hypothetical protein [Sedimentisphaerales bacterium]